MSEHGAVLVAWIDPDRDVSNTAQKRLRRYTRDARPGALRREAVIWRRESARLAEVAQEILRASRASEESVSTLASAEFTAECARLARAADDDAARAAIAADTLDRSADVLERARRGEQSLSDQRQANPHPGPQPGPGAPTAEQVSWHERFAHYEDKRLQREERAEAWIQDVNDANRSAEERMRQVHGTPGFSPGVDWNEVRRRELERLDDGQRHHKTDRESGREASSTPSPAHHDGSSSSYVGLPQASLAGGGALDGTAGASGGTAANPSGGSTSTSVSATAAAIAGAGGGLAAAGAAGGRSSAPALASGGASGTGAPAGGRGRAARSGGPGTGAGAVVAGQGGAARGSRSTGAAGAAAGSRGRRRDEEDRGREHLLLEETWLDDEHGGPATLGR